MRIAFVGGKRSGKSTCAALFSRFLAAKGLPVLAVDAAADAPRRAARPPDAAVLVGRAPRRCGWGGGARRRAAARAVRCAGGRSRRRPIGRRARPGRPRAGERAADVSVGPGRRRGAPDRDRRRRPAAGPPRGRGGGVRRRRPRDRRRGVVALRPDGARQRADAAGGRAVRPPRRARRGRAGPRSGCWATRPPTGATRRGSPSRWATRSWAASGTRRGCAPPSAARPGSVSGLEPGNTAALAAVRAALDACPRKLQQGGPMSGHPAVMGACLLGEQAVDRLAGLGERLGGRGDLGGRARADHLLGRRVELAELLEQRRGVVVAAGRPTSHTASSSARCSST